MNGWGYNPSSYYHHAQNARNFSYGVQRQKEEDFRTGFLDGGSGVLPSQDEAKEYYKGYNEACLKKIKVKTRNK